MIFDADRVTILNIVDGDTVDVMLDLGFKIYYEMRLRLAGIDTPELRSSDPKERTRARLVKEFVESRLSNTDNIVVETFKAGKFGRYLAEFFVNGESLNEELVKEGYAKRYHGGKR